MDLFLLAVFLLLCLFLIPLGLPGTWLMVGAALAYGPLTGTEINVWLVAGAAVLALGAEVVEFTLAARYTRRYGGSRRAGWGAIIGGVVGALVGVPLPIVGSIVGAFGGAFVGAFIAEMTRGAQAGDATRVAKGALVGRAVAAAMKVGVGLVISTWILWAMWK